MKRRMILAALLLSVLLTEGCLLEIHPLTEEEQNIIAEYAADVLLRHDENHVGAALLSPTPTPTPEPTPEPEVVPSLSPTPDPSGNKGNGQGGKEEDNTITTDLNGVFGLEGLEVYYDGYMETTQINSKELSFALVPSKGKKYVCVNFVVSNTASIRQEFDFSSMDISYQLEGASKKAMLPKLTALLEDMQFLKVDLPPERSVTGMLVFEVDQDIDPDNCSLIVRRGDYKTVFELY